MVILRIDGKACVHGFEVIPYSGKHGFTDVFVYEEDISGHIAPASCHSIPSYMVKSLRGSCSTGGHRYEFKGAL